MSLNTVFSERGIFDRAEKATNKYSEAKAREVLETVLMADAQTEKYTNPKYNQDDFLDELIKKEIPGTDIKGDVVIIGNWAFELDRSVPKIGTPLGQADKLVFPTVTVSEVQLANNYRTATFTVTALEETNGISKIEIWLNGEKLDAYDKTYTNIKTEISEDFTVNRNGLYTVKVYGKLMISKTVEVEGIVPAVKFSPNGSTEWKKEHSSKITIEQTGEKVIEMKYLWKTGENEPQASEFIETCTDNSTITGKELTGKYHLWVLLKTDNDKTSICGSEEFYFDNEGPTVTLSSNPTSETSFTIATNAEDTNSGIFDYKVYVNGELKATEKFQNEYNKEINVESMGDRYTCDVVVTDNAHNETRKTIECRTLMYTWEKWTCDTKRIYGETEWENKGSYDHYYDFRPFSCALGEPKMNSETGKWEGYVLTTGRNLTFKEAFTKASSKGYTWFIEDYGESLSKFVKVKDDGSFIYTTHWSKRRTFTDSPVKGDTLISELFSSDENSYPKNTNDDSMSNWYVYLGIK